MGWDSSNGCRRFLPFRSQLFATAAAVDYDAECCKP
jgi:hypothetical protein